jgi:hypothetical protein
MAGERRCAGQRRSLTNRWFCIAVVSRTAVDGQFGAQILETINGARRLGFCSELGVIGSKDPHVLKIPARTAECSLT